MKKVFSIFCICIFMAMSACGPSTEEKSQAAAITCNVIKATKRADIATTIREINTTREKIGENAFLDNADTVETAVYLGLCEEMVAASPRWKEQVQLKTAEFHSLFMKKNLNEYQNLRNNIPVILRDGIPNATGDGTKEFAYQNYKDSMNNPIAVGMIELCSGGTYEGLTSTATMDFLTALGECPNYK